MLEELKGGREGRIPSSCLDLIWSVGHLSKDISLKSRLRAGDILTVMPPHHSRVLPVSAPVRDPSGEEKFRGRQEEGTHGDALTSARNLLLLPGQELNGGVAAFRENIWVVSWRIPVA